MNFNNQYDRDKIRALRHEKGFCECLVCIEHNIEMINFRERLEEEEHLKDFKAV